MPEISEQDFQQLKDQVAGLSSQLASARNRIEELENFATDHLGLDWGTSLVDVNSPHPNQSIDTAEYGGGSMRIGATGQQILSGSGGTNMVYFVPSLSPDPNGQDIKSRIQGTNSATIATLTAASSITSLGLQGSVFTYASDQVNDVAGIRLDPLTPDIVQNTNVDLYAQRSNNFGNMVLTNIVFRLASFTSDPASLADGDMWYRSDTDVIRYRANGATVSIGSGILTDTAWAAKGDLVVGTANDTASILSKGDDGKVLTANSATATGLEWQTPAAGSFSYGKAITTSQGQNLP